MYEWNMKKRRKRNPGGSERNAENRTGAVDTIDIRSGAEGIRQPGRGAKAGDGLPVNALLSGGINLIIGGKEFVQNQLLVFIHFNKINAVIEAPAFSFADMNHQPDNVDHIIF